MKKINVIVKDKNTLVLNEDAKRGDVIDLRDIAQVDTTYIDFLLENEKDKAYQRKKEELKRIIDAENAVERNKLLEDIKRLKQENATSLLLKEKEIENKYFNELNELKKQKELLEYKKKMELEEVRLKLESEKNQALQRQEETFRKELDEKKETIFNLQRQKAVLNVKQTGEDLESWCDNEISSYMQNGFLNCTWTKDNVVVRDEGEQKGSKADYIFKVFASSKHLDSELLASICLDMKDENPDSTNKKKNSDYYKDLDKNRNKKNCKYAVLVSNLESDKPNLSPIMKVQAYPDMYVVRPAYMMTFLNMVVSLSQRFAELILANHNAKLELLDLISLSETFEELKKTYLEKPIEMLERNVEEIRKNNDAVLRASKNIDDLCDKIVKSYLSSIQEKLSKFSIKIQNEYRRTN